MTNSLCDGDAYQPRAIGEWDENSEYAPTPGYFGRTPSALSPTPTPDYATNYVLSDQLEFLPLAEWDEDFEYDEQPPRYISYTIAWKLVINSKTVGSVSEKDLVIAPGDFWITTLGLAIEQML